MHTINLDNIIIACKLDPSELASRLFPRAKHPRMALSRIRSGAGKLDADQISLLSQLTGLSVSELFGTSRWTAKHTKGTHTFRNGVYTAVLDTATWTTCVYADSSLIYESVIHSDLVPLGAYLAKLDEIITDHSNQDKP
jgi:hypothetical protein